MDSIHELMEGCCLVRPWDDGSPSTHGMAHPNIHIHTQRVDGGIAHTPGLSGALCAPCCTSRGAASSARPYGETPRPEVSVCVCVCALEREREKEREREREMTEKKTGE